MRYNRFTKFYIEDNYIIIKIIGLNNFIKIGYDDKIYNFLVFLEKNTFISDKEITEFNIKKNLIKLFIGYSILIEYENNSGIESICFDKFIQNPNNLLNFLNNNQINELYIDVEKGASTLLNKKKLETYSILPNDIDFLIDKNTFNSLGTDRLQKISENYKIDDFLNIVKYIFSPRLKKKVFGIDRKFYKFGSGGGINSIFPVIITKQDDIFIFEKFSGEFFIKNIPGIYNDLIINGLIKCDTNFSAYNYLVIFCSYSKNVFRKYGNKGYKLILLEVGQISFMFRLLCGYFMKPHVEIQGFYDENIYELLHKSEIFNSPDFLVNHILAISD